RVVRGGALEPVPPAGRVVGVVGVAAGVDDERPAGRRGLNRELVVVPVTAVAERAGVEDQPPLLLVGAVGAPAAALGVVAADGEGAGGALGRRAGGAAGRDPAQVGTGQQLGTEREHGPEVALVAVGQRRGQPVRAL